MSNGTLTIEEQRARLEARANAIRSRLFRTIDALDTRRHQVTELGQHAKQLAVPLAVGVVGLAVVGAGMAWAIGAAVERRRERSSAYRISRALAPLRQQLPERPTFWGEAARKIGMAAVGIAATHLLKRGVDYLEAHQAQTRAVPQLTK